MGRSATKPAAAKRFSLPPKPGLTDYWDLGVQVNAALKSQPDATWLELAEGSGLKKDSLRIAAYFAERYTRNQAKTLQDKGVPWRSILQLVRPEKKADRDRLYAMAIKGASNVELAATAARVTNTPITPRLGQDPIHFMRRLETDLEKIGSLAAGAQKSLQDDQDDDRWRSAATRKAATSVVSHIQTATKNLSALKSTIHKKTDVD